MKNLSLLLTCILLAALFAGCTNSSGNKSAPASPASVMTDEKDAIVISVVTSYGGDDGNRQNYEKAYQAYEMSSGNIVKDASAISNEDWKASVMASFASGNEPDVLFYFTGVDSNKLIADGKVVSIDDIRAVYPDYASNMKDDMLAKSPVDGTRYAVPVNGYWEGMYVNKKVLADCGVPIPDATTTWEQFIASCNTILDKGYVPIAASLMEVPHYWFEFCTLNNGGVDSHLTTPQDSGDSAGQIWAAGLNDIKELYKLGFFPENTLIVTAAETDALMTANKAAFMIEGSWKMGWFAENAANLDDFTVTYVPGKAARKNTDIIGGLSMGYFITAKAWNDPEKQQACVEFITAMTKDEVVATFGATAVTALKDGITPPADANNLVKDALAMTGSVTGIASAVGDTLLPNSRSDLFANVNHIVTGGISAEDAIDHCLAIQN